MTCCALRAAALITLQQRSGEWVLLDDLCGHLGAQRARVINVCQQLVQEGAALVHVRSNVVFYGARCAGATLPPVPSEPPSPQAHP